MNKIVFLIGAFVVLLQLHSTTAVADSENGWDKIESTILTNTENMKPWVENLKEAGESAWKDAKVEVPANWTELISTLIKLLDQAKTRFSGLIAELKGKSSADWADLEQGINKLVNRISLKFKEIAQKIVAAASGTQQEIDSSVDNARKELVNLIKIETVNTLNILREEAQKKLNAEQTDSENGWDKIESITIYNTERMKNSARELGKVVKNAEVEVPAKSADFVLGLIKLLSLANETIIAKIAELKKESSVQWEDIEAEIEVIVDTILGTFRESNKKVEAAASGEQQEIDDIVNDEKEVLVNVITTGKVRTINIMEEAAQKNLNDQQTAYGRKSQENV